MGTAGLGTGVTLGAGVAFPCAASLAALALRSTSRVRSEADELEEPPGLSALGGGGHTLGPGQGTGRAGTPVALAGGAVGVTTAGIGLATETAAASLAGLLPRTLVGGGGAATTLAGIALGASVAGAVTTHDFGFVAGVALAPSSSSDFRF